MPLETGVVFSDYVHGYRLSTGEFAICWPLKHLSRGLGWRELPGVIHLAYVDELGGLNHLHDPKATSARERDQQCC